MTAQHLAIVAGAGPGLGQALTKRFADEGMIAVGLGRTAQSKSTGLFHQVDLTDAQATAELIDVLIKEHGAPAIVVHNTAELVIADLADTTNADFESCWRSMVLTAFNLGKATLQPMVSNGGGAFLVSGATASLRGGARFAAFSSAKFALRGLTQSFAREFQPAGVHVAHVLLDGIIDTPRSRDMHSLDPAKMLKPNDIADAYWQVAQQPRSTWTHELDLRPQTESF